MDPLDFMDSTSSTSANLTPTASSTSVNPTPTAGSTEGNTHAQRHQHIPDSA
jgi:hypothetical protein